ncbi:MAG TPA: crosslink repair DNA glycosylase YcaQ family protein, partial [Candidatus Limnocylindrales bacterium]
AETGIVHLVRRYLAALGPATLADAASWSRLPVATLRPAVEALDAEGVLWHGVDDHGRHLLDLAEAPRPGEDAAAPARLLAMWDGLLLGHADRSRVIDPAHRNLIVAGNGDTYPTFLVDGRVAGLWWTRATASGPEIELEPFGPLRPGDRAELETEAAGLAAFLAEREPAAYARYRLSRDRKVARGGIGTSA